MATITGINVNGTTSLNIVASFGGKTSSVPFTVNPLTLTSSNTTITGINSSYTYDGTSHKPVPTVKAPGVNGTDVTLTSGTNYSVTYSSDTTNVGTVTVTITGTGNYTGSVTKSFTITKATLTNVGTVQNQTYTYNGSAQGVAVTPKTVTGTTIANGSNGTIKYRLTSSGDYTLTSAPQITNVADSTTVYYKVTGVSNHNDYEGSYTLTVNKAASTLPSTISGGSVAYDSAPCRATVSTDYSGGTLQYSTDNGSTWSSVTWYNSTTSTANPVRTQSDGVGDTSVVFRVLGDANHNNSSNSSTVTLTIYQNTDAKVEVTTNSSTLTYNKSAQDVVTTVVSHGTSTYSIGFGSSATTAPTSWSNDVTTLSATSAGTYYIWYKFTPDSGHSNSKSATYVGSVTIKQKSIDSTDITVTGTQSYTYTGSAQGPTLTVKDGSTTLVLNTDYTVSGNSNTAAGTYTVTVTGKGNYTGTNTTFTYTIGEKSISIPTPSNVSGDYKGSAYTVSFASCTGATITNYRYSTDNKTWTTSTTNPGQTNVGTLYVQAYYTASTNYTGSNWSSSATITVSRSKTATASASNKTYNGSSQTGVTGSNVSWSGTTAATTVDTYTAYATPTSNYAWSDGTYSQKTISWTMSAKSIASTDISITGTTSYTYTGSAQGPTLTVTDTSRGTSGTVLTLNTDYTVSGNSNTAANTYTVTVTGKGNYTGTNTTFSYTIGKADSTNPTLTNTTAIYDGNAHYISVTGGSGGDIYYATCSTSDGTYSSWTTTKPSLTNAGTIYVKAYVKGDSNHNDSTATSAYTLEVNKRTVTLTAPTATNVTYNGSAQTIFTAGSATTGGVMYYSESNSTFSTSTWSTTIPYTQKTAAGTYRIYWYCYVSDTSNNNDTTTDKVNAVQTLSATINAKSIASSDITITGTQSYTYTGSAQGPTLTVKDGSTTLTLGTDYTVSGNSNTAAGTYTVTVTGKGNYTGTNTTFTYTINTNSSGNISYTLKSSASLYCTDNAQATNVTDAQKTVTIATASASSTTNTGASITYEISVKDSSSNTVSNWTVATSGQTITIPVNQSKGTYTVSVKATVAATSNYDAVSTTKTISVTITEVVLSSIALTLNNDSVVFGSSLTNEPASVIATYSNSKTLDVTSSATLTSSPTGYVTIS